MKRLLIVIAARLFAATSYTKGSDDIVFENGANGE
jgi:hypothetical protein